MKKRILLILLLLPFMFLFGCTKLINNEIYNKSYNVTIDIQEFEDLIVAAIEKAAPAVVGVSSYERSGLTDFKLASTGSGVVYSCEAKMVDGSIVDDCTKTIDSNNEVEYYQYKAITNRHVIKSKSLFSKVKVFMGEYDSKIDANVLGYDDKVDIAVITFIHTKYIQPLEFANSEMIQRGNFAIAIGNPNGYEYYGSATFGIISYPKRYISDDTNDDGINDWDSEYIQHDVAINPGNSGGALINIKGELIGINTLKLVATDTDNMGFAIPSNLVKELITHLEKGQTPQRMTLGISVYEVKVLLNKEDYQEGSVPDIVVPEDVTYGLYVDSVDMFGLAYDKLMAGDFILELNGVKINSSQEFRAELGKILKGESANLKVYRGSNIIEVTINY